jgi:hypothetical protein
MKRYYLDASLIQIKSGSFSGLQKDAVSFEQEQVPGQREEGVVSRFIFPRASHSRRMGSSEVVG